MRWRMSNSPAPAARCASSVSETSATSSGWTRPSQASRVLPSSCSSHPSSANHLGEKWIRLVARSQSHRPPLAASSLDRLGGIGHGLPGPRPRPDAKQTRLIVCRPDSRQRPAAAFPSLVNAALGDRAAGGKEADGCPFGPRGRSRYNRAAMIAWAPGTRLGPYELTAPIGAGGMGEVWKARDTRVDRDVAIKRLKVEHSERFKREARAVAALNHPHICQLYDVGPDYLVMEYVEGEILEGPRARGRRGAAGGANRRGTGRRASEGHRASRPEAGQRAGDRGGRQAPRLRPGPDGLGAIIGRCDDERDRERTRGHRRHGGLHVARAGPGAARGHALGRLLLRRGPLRSVERPPGICRRDAAGDAVGGGQRRAAADGRAADARPNRGPLSGQAAARPFPVDGGRGCRPGENRGHTRRPTPVDRGAAVRQHEPGPGRRLLQRRPGRGADQPARPCPEPQGRRAHLVLRLPRPGAGHQKDRRGARRQDDSRGQRPPGGKPGPRDGAVDQRRRRLSPVVRTVRPRAHRRLRHSGRDRPGDQRRAAAYPRRQAGSGTPRPFRRTKRCSRPGTS